MGYFCEDCDHYYIREEECPYHNYHYNKSKIIEAFENMKKEMKELFIEDNSIEKLEKDVLNSLENFEKIFKKN